MSRFDYPSRNFVTMYERRFQELERRFENLHRVGTVKEVKYDKDRKRWYAKMSAGEDGKYPFESDWLPWKSFAHGAISASIPPKVGQSVEFHSPSGNPETATLSAYHNNPDTPSPHDKEDEVVFQIKTPKKSDNKDSSGTSGSGSTTGQSSSGSQSSSDQQQDTDTLRLHMTDKGYMLTIGKIGEGKDTDGTDGDGQTDKNGKNTFQMAISRDAKTITCGKFKAVIGKDGAKLSYGDKVSFELKDGQIQSTVDGATHTLTKDNIVAMLGQSSHSLSDGDFKVSGGTIHHDNRNIGSSHTHSGVMVGGAKTQPPDA